MRPDPLAPPAPGVSAGTDGTPRLMRGYFLLAGLFLLVLAAGLILHEQLRATHAESQRINHNWARRQADYVQIGRLASHLNSPANNVFETLDTASEQRQLDAALEALGAAIAAAERDLAAELTREREHPPIQWRIERLRSYLAVIGDHAAEILDEAHRILAFFRTGQTAGAGARMAVMDRAYARLTDQVAGMGYTVREIQDYEFARSRAVERTLARVKYAIDGATMALVLALAVYGGLLGRRLRRAAGEREAALAAARANAQRIEAVLNSSLDALIASDGAGRITEFNPAACALFGYERAAVVGRDLAETIVPEAQRAAHRLGFARHLATGESHILDRRIHVTALRQDGSEFPAELTVTRFDDHGQPAFCAFLRDISSRLSVEQALRDGEARLRSLVDNAADAIITAGEDGRIQSWNAGAERIFGYTADEAIGRNVGMLTPAPHDRHDAYLARYRRESVPRLMGRPRELEGRRKDGSAVPLELALSEVPLAGGRVFSAIIRDVTARRAVEAELRAAKEAAEEATRAKSLFLATMSHEIRTPMNGIIGMTSLLLDTPLGEEQRDCAETIRASADGLLTIINDILDFSKIESGRLELEAHPFDLRECVEGALDLVAHRADAKGLDLAYTMDDAVPEGICGDATRLRQILVNLLGNAVKFTDAGEVSLHVSARPVEGGATPLVEVAFAIVDTGIGIPADRRDRLFRSFSQVDASTTRTYGGTGLGLAISRRLAELMGGAMNVDSTVGRGSCFRFTIVAPPVDAPDDERADEGGAPPLVGRSLLVVDDNATNRRIATRHSETWGMQSYAAVSAAEALDWIDRGMRFDVAVIDRHLPGTDGIALARAIRARGLTMPLVVLGPRGADADDAGLFAATLHRPIKPAQLLDALLAAVAPGVAAPLRPPRNQTELDTTTAARLPLRILLAEDNPINQKVAMRILARLGYRPDLAANGLEVLEALERQEYDVVLLDVQMPEMDGLTAAREIRARWPSPRPRLIAMTANAIRGDREACLAAGMDDYLSKPVHPNTLADALNRSSAVLASAPGRPRPAAVGGGARRS